MGEDQVLNTATECKECELLTAKIEELRADADIAGRKLLEAGQQLHLAFRILWELDVDDVDRSTVGLMVKRQAADIAEIGDELLNLRIKDSLNVPNVTA